MSARSSQGALFSGLQEGALVLADISGYSRFVAQTEVDHSWSVLHELLATMVRSLSGRMDVSQVEGDAILFISGLSTPEVIAAVEGTFVAFHRRLRVLQAVTTCLCSACANISMLKLKFVVHHGKFSRQRLGSVEQLHGTDVIVAHRLLKNSVPSKEYLLVTDAVLDRLPTGTLARFTPDTESFDLGSISGGDQQIAHVWEEARARERQRVAPEEAQVNSEVTVDAPIDLVHSLMLEPDVMQRYLFSDDVVVIPGARGEELGSEFHCHHGGSVVTLRVVSTEPGRELTLYSDQPTDMYITSRIAHESDGRTSIMRSFLWDEPADPEVAEGLGQLLSGPVH